MGTDTSFKRKQRELKDYEQGNYDEEVHFGQYGDMEVVQKYQYSSNLYHTGEIRRKKPDHELRYDDIRIQIRFQPKHCPYSFERSLTLKSSLVAPFYLSTYKILRNIL